MPSTQLLKQLDALCEALLERGSAPVGTIQYKRDIEVRKTHSGWRATPRDMFEPDPEDIRRALTKYSLGIPRKQMPQIRADHTDAFVAYLKKQGIKVHVGEQIPAGRLKPTQGEVNIDEILKMTVWKQPIDTQKRPVIVSKDNYILDGHHRWAVLYITDPQAKMNSIRVNVSIKKLLELANSFEHTTYKDIGEAARRVRERTGRYLR